jgi:uncharacterized membrane protein
MAKQEPADLDRPVARLLWIGTLTSVALLGLGSLVLLGAGRSPLEHGPALDLARLVPDIAALRPEGFLWLGLLLVIATPATRVAVTLVAYLRRGEAGMAAVSVGILVVIALGVGLSLVG